MKHKLPSALTYWRRMRYMSQFELATKLGGVSQPTISLWERGHRHPTPDQLHRLSDVLGVSVRDLIKLPDGVIQEIREAWSQVGWEGPPVTSEDTSMPSDPERPFNGEGGVDHDHDD